MTVSIVSAGPFHCRWPVSGSGAETLFCGEPRVIDGAAEHLAEREAA